MAHSPSSPRDRLRIEVVLPNGERYDFFVPGSSFTVGRRVDCDLQLPNPMVSGRHARFEWRDPGGPVLVTDLQSKNGTLVGGHRIRPNQPVVLEPGAEVAIADSRITVWLGAEEETGPSFDSLERSRSLSRAMMCGLLGRALDRSRAVLEVLRGPARGVKLAIDADRSQVFLGHGQDVDLDLSDRALAGQPVTIRQSRESYLVEAHPLLTLRIDGRPIQTGTPLRSGQKIRIGRSVVRFTDPLQSAVDDLQHLQEEGDAQEKPAAMTEPARPASPPRAGHPVAWLPVEKALLLFAMVAVMLGLGLVAIFFLLLD